MSGADPWPAPRRLVLLGAGLVIAAAAITVASPGGDAGAAARTDETLTVLGGLGGGRTADTRRCRAAFDPRLDATCELQVGATPGAGVLCPDHRSRTTAPVDGD